MTIRASASMPPSLTRNRSLVLPSPPQQKNLSKAQRTLIDAPTLAKTALTRGLPRFALLSNSSDSPDWLHAPVDDGGFPTPSNDDSP